MPQEAHVLTDHSCWCEPKIEQACPLCEGKVGHKSCPYCHGTGWTLKWSDRGPFLVIHRINRPRVKGGWVW